jgi:hypothetical protein
MNHYQNVAIFMYTPSCNGGIVDLGEAKLNTDVSILSI